MKHISWGFIGFGETTERKSGAAFNAVTESHVQAVYNQNARCARTYANLHDISRWYTDPQLLVNDPNVNAIYIATPPSAHATYAIMAMRAGKPCLIEKPLAGSYEDCVRINRVAEQTGVPCFVAYYRRYLPYFKKVKAILQSGAIGKVLSVQIRFAVPAEELDNDKLEEKPWRLEQQEGGRGYFYDFAPHQIDLLQSFFGIIVKAHGYTANRTGMFESEDTVNAVFRFASGLCGSGSWSFTAHESAKEESIEIYGTEGRIVFSVYNYDPITLYTSQGMEYIDIKNPHFVQEPLIRSVVQDLQGYGKCEINSIEATPTNWVMDRILGKY